MLAKAATSDNLRLLLCSGSGAKDVSNEHTLTAALLFLLRFLYNNAVNYLPLQETIYILTLQ
jgi:hypothetical protein